MKGLQSLASARLSGVPVESLQVSFAALPTPSVYVFDGAIEAALAIEKTDSAPRCDFRLVLGLRVVVHADRWQPAWPFFDAIVDAGPASAMMIARDMAATWTQAEGLKTWEL